MGLFLGVLMFESRDFQGYFQDREVVGDKVYPWRFRVTGFCFDDVSCHVLKTDGSVEQVPITEENCILICGQYYDHRYWDH